MNVATAHPAARSLARAPHPERAAALDRVLQALSVPDPAVLEVLTEISSMRSARYEIEAARNTLLGAFAEVADNAPPRLRSAAVYMPSNVVLYSYILYLLVPSLYTDRLSFRPSRHVKDQTARIHQLLQPVHQLPIELCDLSQRTFLEQEVDPADLVVFTGRYGNAEQIRPRLRKDQLMLFFGMGVNPFVVAPDAQIPDAARDLADVRLLNTGQDCLAPDAVFVHEDIADPFLEALVAELAARRYGPYRDPEADYGPLYYEEAFDEAVRFLTRWRRHIVHGGGIDAGPLRVDPTVVVRDDLSQARTVHEFFAPVFNVFRYRDEGDLKEIFASNQYSERAMGASVYGTPGPVVTYLERKHTVTRNQTLVAVDDGNQPFGGRGRMANYASFGGSVHTEPILVSKAAADHFRRGAAE
jgi:aldehyde dehydrogenase (NAD+)